MPSIVRRAALLGFVVALTGNTGPALTGQWGAPGTNLIVGADGARIEQECAGGSFTSATPGADGRFTVKGWYESYGPGPQRADATAAANATFEGRLQGDTLRLTIRPANGTPQQLTLLRGKRAKLIRCY